MPIRPENLDRYPADWAKISFRIRFARALGHCECEGECRTGHAGRCEARHNGQHPRTGSKVVLTVAHLDHTPENCDPANLRAYCQACHLAYDADEHKATAARTRAAQTAAWNTPLPTLEPTPVAHPEVPRVGPTAIAEWHTPSATPQQQPSSSPTGAIPNRSHFPVGKDGLEDFGLIRIPETPEEFPPLAAAYVASRARALGWTRERHEDVLLALFQPPRKVSDQERHTMPGLYQTGAEA